MPERRCNTSQIKVGDRLSRTQYYRIAEIPSGWRDRFVVENEEGFSFSVTSEIVATEMYSATQYEALEKISRTEIVERFENAGDTCFTVTFQKQATDAALATRLAGLEGGLDAYSTVRKRRKLARDLLAGEERVLTGYLVSTEPKMGRSMVVDLEIPPDKHRLRLVDHRTISALILKNVRYFCK